jgi:sec-independent protein translocase protein TatB
VFDVGFSELMVIAVVALIVIGPERLPRVARTLGHLFGRLQRYVNDVKADINREIEHAARGFESSVNTTVNSVQTEVNKTESELNSLAQESAPAAVPATGVSDAAGGGSQPAAPPPEKTTA